MKNFAVLGLGRFGSAVARQLFDMGYEVLAVDVDMDKVNLMADRVTQAIGGDVKDESVLKAIGISNYDCVVVAIGNISDSILATLMVKEAGVGTVVCKAVDLNHKKVLQKIGADSVIIPEFEIGIKTAVSLVSNHLLDFIDLSDKYGIIDIAVPKSWIGHTIGSLDVRNKYGMNIIAIKDAEEDSKVILTPGAQYEFHAADIIVFVGEIKTVNILNSL